MSNPGLGRKVWHPELGAGTCVGVNTGGAGTRLEVDFGFLRREYALDALLDGPGGSPLQPDAWGFAPHGTAGVTASGRRTRDGVGAPTGRQGEQLDASSARLNARRAVFALRLGQVPENLVLELSVGTEDLTKSMDSAVQSARTQRPSFLIVEGPWGAGKSHALTLLMSRARTEGFVTSGVVLDGLGTSLCAPMTLLEGIASAVRFADGATDTFGDRLAALLRNNLSSRLRSHGALTLATALDQLPIAVADDGDAWQVVEDYVAGAAPAAQASRDVGRIIGRKISLPPMKANALVDRPGRTADLLAEWAHAAVAMRTSGLAVVLDEADAEFAIGGKSERERSQREQLIESLIRIESGTPLLLAIAAAPATSTDLDPVRQLSEMFDGVAQVIRVPELSLESLRTLGKRVCQVYARAYPADRLDDDALAVCVTKAIAIHRVQSDAIPRRFVRTLLELLDTTHRIDAAAETGRSEG